MKYIKIILCILLIVVMFSGCSLRLASSVNDLISAVAPFGENARVKNAMDSYLGKGYSLKNPTSGDYITSFNFYDVDNDTVNEAIAFYETKDALGTVKMALLKQNGNKWEVLSTVDGLGESAYRLDFCDVDNDSQTEILVCWNSISNSTSHSLTVYNIDFDDEYNFKQLGDSKTINNYYIGDFTGSGNNELLILQISSGTKNSSKAELYRLGSTYNLIGETRLDSRVLSYNNLTGENVNGTMRLYADAIGSSGETKLTEILYYSNAYNSIISPFYSYSSGTTNGTSRSCLINSMDINSDSNIEIPTDAYYDEFPTGVYSIDWKVYKNTVLMHTDYSLYVRNDNYTVIIPDDYLEKINVTYDKDSRELVVSSKSDNSPVFEIKPVLKAVYEDGEFTDYTLINENNGYNYLAKSYDNSEINITLDNLKEYIKIC